MSKGGGEGGRGRGLVGAGVLSFFYAGGTLEIKTPLYEITYSERGYANDDNSTRDSFKQSPPH